MRARLMTNKYIVSAAVWPKSNFIRYPRRPENACTHVLVISSTLIRTIVVCTHVRVRKTCELNTWFGARYEMLKTFRQRNSNRFRSWRFEALRFVRHCSAFTVLRFVRTQTRCWPTGIPRMSRVDSLLDYLYWAPPTSAPHIMVLLTNYGPEKRLLKMFKNRRVHFAIEQKRPSTRLFVPVFENNFTSNTSLKFCSPRHDHRWNQNEVYGEDAKKKRLATSFRPGSSRRAVKFKTSSRQIQSRSLVCILMLRGIYITLK